MCRGCRVGFINIYDLQNLKECNFLNASSIRWAGEIASPLQSKAEVKDI